LIKILTLDNGTEFAAYGLLSQSLGAKVFFCEPYKSYQKGAIENASKLIRTKLPRKTCIENLNQTVSPSVTVGLGLAGTIVGGAQASHNPSSEGYGFGLSGGVGGAMNVWGKGNENGDGGVAGGGVGIGFGAAGRFSPANWGTSKTYDWDDIFDPFFGERGIKSKNPC
jgi:hypothetical protein